jgi:hypothetical protein
MLDDKLTQELAALKAQFNALEQERAQAAPGGNIASPAHEPQQAASEPDAGPTDADDNWLEGLAELEPEQLVERIKVAAGEWFDDVNEELKDVKPSTLLLIFGLGVLAGRLTH